MGPWMTLFAIMKAYCAINVLLLPCSFVKGGWLLAPLAMITACFFETLCAYRLAEVAIATRLYSYPCIVEKAIGENGKTAIRVLLALAHF